VLQPCHSLRAKRDRKWQFRSNAVSLIQTFRYKGSHPPIIFAQIVRPMNALHPTLTVFRRRNFVADFLQAKCDFRWLLGVLRFWAPLWGAKRQRRMIILGFWKVRSGLLISVSLLELFSLQCHGWGATSEYRLKIGAFAQTGASWPKISGRRINQSINQNLFSEQ